MSNSITGETNLESMFARADQDDLREGMVAYQRYHDLMKEISIHFSVSLDRVVATFAALSPNNDYVGNLRSLVTVLDGYTRKVPVEQITVSTYNHAKVRAWLYLTGAEPFVHETRGRKILNFYHNILFPGDGRYVTIDGHIAATWMGNNKATMKDTLVSGRQYDIIAASIKQLAFRHFVRPNQYQATIWFTRKRILNIKYDPQLDIFSPKGDVWKIYRNVAHIEPFT